MNSKYLEWRNYSEEKINNKNIIKNKLASKDFNEGKCLF